MRRRFVVATLLVALTAIAVLGIPLAFVGSRLLHNENLRALDGQADQLALAIEDAQERHVPIDVAVLRPFARDGHWVQVIVGSETLQSGPRPHRATLSAPVVTAQGAQVRVGEAAGDLGHRAILAWAVVAGLSVIGIIASVGLGLIQSRRVTRPLVELAAVSRRLGAGDFSARVASGGVAEIAAVADALNASAERIGSLLDAERRFTIDASHQLRTPLTALRMRLEEIEMTEDLDLARDEVSAALVQADRLTATITELLEVRRRGRAGEQMTLDVGTLACEQALLWKRTFAGEGRRLEVESGQPNRVLATPGAVRQALDVLLDNALRHGAGTVRVSIAPIGEGVAIRVSDEGPGMSPAQVSVVDAADSQTSDGVGIALARALIEAEGGRVQLVRPRPPMFEIVLPLTALQ